MFHDQYPSGGEFASPAELGRVLELGGSWLVARGEYMSQGGVSVDEVEGYPVIVSTPEFRARAPQEIVDIFLHPSYRAIIPRRILDVIAPGAGEALGASDHIVLEYFIPCYNKEEGELTYQTPSLLVEIPRPEGGEITEECLIITREEDENVTSDRIPTTRGGGIEAKIDLLLDMRAERETGEISDSLQEHFHAQSFAEQTGLAHITLDELDAIEKIFIALKIHST